jgi:hypothetical protein
LMLTPGMHLVIGGPHFYLRTMQQATTALYGAHMVMKYESDAVANSQLPLPFLRRFELKQEATECARAAGIAFSSNQRALTGTLDDVRKGATDTLTLVPCKSLVTSVKKSLSGVASTAAREAEGEAPCAEKVGAYFADRVSEKWWQKVKGSLVKYAVELLRVHQKRLSGTERHERTDRR